METLQWIIAAITAGFVASVGYLQWRTAQNKAVLDLFDQRYQVYEGVRKAVAQIVTQPQGFGPKEQMDFLHEIHRAYFFFGDDIHGYLEQLCKAILDVTDADKELQVLTDPTEKNRCWDKRDAAFQRVSDFYETGPPLFARYMRFSETVPQGSSWSLVRRHARK
jgi:hypothetical protein